MRTPPPDTSENPAALYQKLEKLLEVANAAFGNPQIPTFLHGLLQIPDIVAALQPLIGKKRTKRVPFWKCVVALDKARPKLALIATLDALVRRATEVPRSPIIRLLLLLDEEHLSFEERAVATELISLLENDSVGKSWVGAVLWPEKLDGLLSAELRAAVKGVRRNLPPAIRERSIDSLFVRSAQIDLELQQRRWREKFMPALEPFVLLLSLLENEKYDRERDKILRGEILTTAILKRNYKRFFTRQRVRAFRE